MVANLRHEREKTLSLDMGILSGYRAGLSDLEAAPAWVVGTALTSHLRETSRSHRYGPEAWGSTYTPVLSSYSTEAADDQITLMQSNPNRERFWPVIFESYRDEHSESLKC